MADSQVKHSAAPTGNCTAELQAWPIKCFLFDDVTSWDKIQSLVILGSLRPVLHDNRRDDSEMGTPEASLHVFLFPCAQLQEPRYGGISPLSTNDSCYHGCFPSLSLRLSFRSPVMDVSPPPCPQRELPEHCHGSPSSLSLIRSSSRPVRVF